VLRQLGSDNAAALQGAHLVVLQRLSEAEAAIATGTLGRAAETGARLTGLPDDMLALLHGDTDRYVWIAPTGIERQYHGAPRR
jgi:hypothetical protein